jgi:hypothetical protein
VGEQAATTTPPAMVATISSAARREQVKPCMQEATSGILIELVTSGSGMQLSVALGQGAKARDRSTGDVVDDDFADEAERLGFYGVSLGDRMVIPRVVDDTRL